MTGALSLGIDVGGSKIAAGLLGPSGTRLPWRRVRPSPRGGPALRAALEELARDAAAAADDLGGSVASACIGMPELVDLKGRIRSSWSFDLGEEPLRLGLVPTRVDSDVRLGALAEMRCGAAAGAPSFIYASLGTGFSAVFGAGGQLWSGHRGFAIHPATHRQHVTCGACTAPQKIMLEDLVSGSGLEAAWRRRTGGSHELPEIVALARNGDGEACAHLEAAGRALGSLLAQAANWLDPERLVLGGGLGATLADTAAHGPFRAVLAREIFAESCKTIGPVPARFGADAGLVGAALAARDALGGPFPADAASPAGR